MLVQQHHGRIVDSPGDNLLAEFSSALHAIEAAAEIQRVIRARNEAVPASRRMHFRIGIHLGDVRVERERIYGDGVNIAARLQELAEAGGICISGAVYDLVGGKLDLACTALGAQQLKNIPEPVRAYRIRTEAPAAAPEVGRRARRWGIALVATAALAAAILAAWRLLAPIEDRASTPGPIRSLAVLPLENLSGDPEQEYFADGMTEALTGDLGKIGSLRVISRTSAMQYKGARKPLPQIARELGVDAVIEGTVTRQGDRVRIAAQLIDGRTDEHLWAERYERPLRDVLELQSEVAKAIAREIRLELTPSERARLENRGPVDPAAHDALLKGLYHFGRFTPESMRSAIAAFERAIDLDPGHALAHAWLGHAWYALAGPLSVLSAVTTLEGMPKAKSAALRALELDDSLAEAHTALGSVALLLEWDWPASERYLRRALELNPSLPWAHAGYAGHLGTRGRHDEAIAEGRRAVELAPLELRWRDVLSSQYRWARRYDEALEEARKVVEMDPTFQRGYWVLAAAYEALGRYEEVIGAWERSGRFTPENASALRRALSQEGPQSFWREALRMALNAPEWRHTDLAWFHARLGERDEAFAELERAYASREAALVFLRVDFRLDPIRDDPRFDDLVRRVGIPER
jgi:TolB-like protein